MRPRKGSDPVVFTTNVVIRNLARRVKRLNAEMAEIDGMLTELLAQTAPSLLALYGAGTDTTASLLITAGDNPRPHPHRRVLGSSLWDYSAPSQLRQDNHQIPAQPGR